MLVTLAFSEQLSVFAFMKYSSYFIFDNIRYLGLCILTGFCVDSFAVFSIVCLCQVSSEKDFNLTNETFMWLNKEKLMKVLTHL